MDTVRDGSRGICFVKGLKIGSLPSHLTFLMGEFVSVSVNNRDDTLIKNNKRKEKPHASQRLPSLFHEAFSPKG